MNLFLKKLFFTCFFYILSSQAFCDDYRSWVFKRSSFLGSEINKRKIGLIDNLIYKRKQKIEQNFYSGIDLSKYFSVEFGIYNNSRYGKSSYKQGDRYLGEIEIIDPQGAQVNTSSEIKGYYNNLIWFKPMRLITDFELITSLGFSKEKVATVSRFSSLSLPSEFNSRDFVFSKVIYMPHIGIGFQKLLKTAPVKLKFTILWSKTSKYSSLKESNNKNLYIKQSDSIIGRFGIVYCF